MKAYQNLPEEYKAVLQINMQKDKKTALKINIGGAVVMAVMLAAGFIITPLNLGLFQLVVMAIGYVAYIVLHELTHAIAMKAGGGGKVKFGFTGMYAFAGSEEDYFDITSYRLIALAPLIVWGIIFIVLQLAVPQNWFWVVWLWQIGNVAGAAGDVYVTAVLWNKPETILVRDTGVDMTVYNSSQQ